MARWVIPNFAIASSIAGGEIVAVHWRGHSADHLVHGDLVHKRLAATFGPPFARYEQAEFRLDVWSAA